MLSPRVVQFFPRAFRFLTLSLAALICAAVPGRAQELVVQPTPFTVLLDFAALRSPLAPKQSLPIWLESAQILPAETPGKTEALTTGTAVQGLPEEKTPPHTVYRLRLRAMPGLNDAMLLRVFFDDRANAHPTVTAWSETGTSLFASGPLGAGLELPAWESLSIPTAGVNYVDIDVPGDGLNVRKVFLATLKKSVVSHALDFAPAPAKENQTPVNDPFGNATPQPAAENDSYLFGRVRATLEAGVIKLSPPSSSPAATAVTTGTTLASGTAAQRTSVSFEFSLESAPLLAAVTLDILNADPLAPLQAWVNNTALGAVAWQFPDLADPAFTGSVRTLEPMRFHYGGWVHGLLILPGSALRAGTNTLTLQLPADASPVAIRAIELQLKQNWRILDYTLTP